MYARGMTVREIQGHLLELYGLEVSPDLVSTISAMVSHFLFEAEFCNPAAGWEKGQVEKNVQDARHRLWQPMPSFASLEALNEWLEARCRELWSQSHGSHGGVIADAWAEEVASLMEMSRPFDGFVEYAKRVSTSAPAW